MPDEAAGPEELDMEAELEALLDADSPPLSPSPAPEDTMGRQAEEGAQGPQQGSTSALVSGAADGQPPRRRRRSVSHDSPDPQAKRLQLERPGSFREWMRPAGLQNMPSFSSWNRQHSPPVELRPPTPPSEPVSPEMPGFSAPAASKPPLHTRATEASTSGSWHPSSEETSAAILGSTGWGDLEHLPHAVLFRMLCCLSADSLATVSLISRTLRQFSLDNSLWRRLYLGRWHMPEARQLRSHRVRGARSWMGYYKDRDMTDAQEMLEKMPEDMREACRQMHRALRKTTVPLGVSQADDLVISDGTEADKVVQWRRAHGKPDVVAFHSCPRAGGAVCRFVNVGDMLVCERSGWAHLCDDTCAERIQTSSGLMVCPISGRCFETLMTEAEEAAMRGGPGEGAYDEDFYEKGTLGRSFESGYNCSDERDLQLTCGVRFSN